MPKTSTKPVSLRAAGRTLRGLLAHAQAQAEPLLGVAVNAGRVVLSAPGPSSLVYAVLEVEGEPPAAMAGGFQAPRPDARLLADDADVELSLDGEHLRIGAGRSSLRATRVSDEPVEVEWVWPAAAPDVELAVGRDALLDALPDARGTIRFDGPDKQLVLEWGAGERRLSLANRPRRRKSVSVPVDFGRLRQAVEPHGERVRLGLTEGGRPLTVESDSVRAVLSPAEPQRPARAAAPHKQAATPKPAEQRDAQREQREAAARREQERQAQERRDAERREAEERRRADEERRAAKAAQQAGRALERAGAQLEAAAQALEGSPIEDTAERVKDLRERVVELQRSMGERG